MSRSADQGLVLVTGATGLLGSHVAEQLVARGRPVRALVRPTSRTEFLERLGVELVEGDLTDPSACRRATQGAELVFHAAAKVGDWGRWEEFQTSCVDATESLAQAALEAGVERFVHFSSTSAYGHPTDDSAPIDETHPLGLGMWWAWDYYTRSKVECEKLLWRMAADQGLPLTVIRPSWLFGERDRTTISRLASRLNAGKVLLIGRGDNPLSAVYAGAVAEAAILTIDTPSARGQAYNITDLGPITQSEFLNLFATAVGAPPVTRRVPYSAVYSVAFLAEAQARFRRSVQPPFITRYATWLMGRTISYSTRKAREELGWSPSWSYAQSIDRSARWYLQQTYRPMTTIQDADTEARLVER